MQRLYSQPYPLVDKAFLDFTNLMFRFTKDTQELSLCIFCEANQFNQTKWNSIVNKTPLFERTNRIIGENAPSDYLMKIEKSNHVERTNLEHYIKTHKIDENDFRVDNFDEFFIKRDKSFLGFFSYSEVE
jgi:hypothetical protein